MKLTILMFLIGVCIVSAKYLPNDIDNSGQLLGRFKRSDLDESDGSSEDENDSKSNNDDDDDGEGVSNREGKHQQSKQVVKIEKMRQKLLEKQEKERQKQEEAQRKLEEKLAKELEKEEEKRQKEKRKQDEKLEKERRKLEEEQKKIQEKILENERKRQEKIQRELEELEKNTLKIQESSESYVDDSIKELFKMQIYGKYGVNEANTNLEKQEALRRYMQEELGINGNSTESERRKAVLDLVQTKLQNASEINALQDQLLDYIKYVGVQKIRGRIDKDIGKLQNKTEMLNNVNLTWVSTAKQNIAEQVSFLESIKQILSNVLPAWFSNSQPKVNSSVSLGVDNTKINDSFNIAYDANNLIQEENDAAVIQATENIRNVSLSNSNLGDDILRTQNVIIPLTELILNQTTNPSEISSGKSTLSNSPVVESSKFESASDIINQKKDASSNNYIISNLGPVDITTENVSIMNIISSLDSSVGGNLPSLSPDPQVAEGSSLSGNNNEPSDSQNRNSSKIAEDNQSSVSGNNVIPSGNKNLDYNPNISSIISVDAAAKNIAVPIIDSDSSMKSLDDANSSSVLSTPHLIEVISSSLPRKNNETYSGENVNSSPNNSFVSNLVPVDMVTEFVSNLIPNIIISVNSSSNIPSLFNPKANENPSLESSNNNVPFDNQNESNNTNNVNIIFADITTENVLAPISSSVNSNGDTNLSPVLSGLDLIEVNSSLIYENSNASFDNQNIDNFKNPNISNISSFDVTTENIPKSIIDTLLVDSTDTNSNLYLVSGNNIEFSNNQDIAASSNIIPNIVETTTEYVTNYVADIISVNVADNVNSSSLSSNITFIEASQNLGSEINVESSNNTLEQSIVSVGSEVFSIKNNAQKNVSINSDINDTNNESTGIQLPQIPTINEGVEALNQTFFKPSIDNSGIFNTEQQLSLNEVTVLSTEQTIVAETTLHELSTDETIMKIEEITPILSVPAETGALMIDIVKQ